MVRRTAGRLLTDLGVIVKAADLKDLEFDRARYDVGKMTDLLGNLYGGRSCSCKWFGQAEKTERAKDDFLVKLPQGYFLVLYG